MRITAAIEDQRGTIAGPVTTREQAFATIAADRCHVALIDADLPEAIEVIDVLTAARLPYVLHASGPICHHIARTSQGGAALFRPVDPAIVIIMIAMAIDQADESD